MLIEGIVNPHILSLVAKVRHTNTLVIADAAFPFWPEIETVVADRLRGPDVKRCNRVERLGSVDLNGGNDFGTRTYHQSLVGTVGDRRVELLYVGNGHTSGDTVAVVPDVDVFFVGDLLEESAPPSYGEDSFPLEWPDTLNNVVGMMTASTKVVPGHGAVVDVDFARDQAIDLGSVANTISALHHAGTPLDDALKHTEDWPWPVEKLQEAIRRGYQVLGTPRRPTLPLLGPG